MAKLTRTQKYADLRTELANDKETTTATQELNSYADRFNNVQETLAPARGPEYTYQPEQQPAQAVPNYNYQQATRPAEPTQYNWKPAQPVQPAFEQPVQPARPAFEQPVQQTFEQPVQPTFEEPVQQSFEQPAFKEPVEQPTQNNQSSYYDSFMNAPKQEKQDDFSSFFKTENTTDLGIDDIYKEVFNDVNDNTNDTISRKERDTYLNQTISDVNFHNIVNGETTLDQIVDNAVNEVRHAQPVQPAYHEPEVADNTYAFNPTNINTAPLDADAIVDNSANDDEFSNTVSMEISKIMDSMSIPTSEVKKVIEEPTPAPVVEEEVKIEIPVVEDKHEEIVEIKNISEIKDEPMKNTVSGTIPFVVTTDEEEDIEDEDETEGSNTILNIILIVLIIVLMAVLGLIIFYILKTKGIF